MSTVPHPCRTSPSRRLGKLRLIGTVSKCPDNTTSRARPSRIRVPQSIDLQTRLMSLQRPLNEISDLRLLPGHAAHITKRSRQLNRVSEEIKGVRHAPNPTKQTWDYSVQPIQCSPCSDAHS